MSLRKLYYKLPISLRYLARRIVYAPTDLLESLNGDRNELVPPKGMIFTGPGNFIKEGQKLLDQFKDFGQLAPSDNVLDIGSGIGRAAVALTSYLAPTTRYHGFDPVDKGVNWCNKKISPKFPNFSFEYIPLKNDLYQKSGQSATEFTFPFKEGAWDFVILTSVFTHMVPQEIDRYLGEIRRMLSPGGRVFATFFIVEAGREISNSAYQFPFEKNGFRLMDDDVASANVALQKDFLFELIAKNNLTVAAEHLGFWNSGIRKGQPNFQDVLILKSKN